MRQNTIKETVMSREATILSSDFQRGMKGEVSNIDEKSRTVTLSFASEVEVERWFGIEALEVSRSAVDLSRLNNGGALLSEHNRSLQIGVVDKAWVGDDKRAYATVRFGSSAKAKEEFQDVVDGIRSCVSCGYRILDYKTEKGKAGAPDKVTATRWMPLEVSLVSIPADASVGVGRSEEESVVPDLKPAQDTENNRKEKMDKQEENVSNPEPKAATVQERSMPDAGQTAINRVNQFVEYGRAFGDESLARQIAASPDKTFADLQRAFQDKFAVSTPTPQAQAPSELGLSNKEKREFSIVRAIKAAADHDWRNAGFEREVSDALADVHGRQSGSEHSILIPQDILSRDLSVGGGLTTGGALVGTAHMAAAFIDILRNNMVFTDLGVRIMSGLAGDVQIPRQDGAATAYWVDEGAAPTESEQAFNQITMSPKTMGAVTEFTRKLLLQSSPDIEQIVLSDLAQVMARAYDYAILNGSGASGQPRGILNTTGVDEVAIISSAWGYADAIKMQTEIAEDNAPEGSAYLMRPGIQGTLKTRPKIGSTFPVFVCEENGNIAGRRSKTSMQVPASTIVFGDYSQILVGQWGVLELEANRSGSTFRSGNVEVRALQSMDVAVRYPQAFKKNTSFA